MKLKFLYCLGAFCATSIYSFGSHWDDYQNGDEIRLIADYEGISLGTILYAYDFRQDANNNEKVVVYYNGEKHFLHDTRENEIWVWQVDNTRNVVRSIGFLTGLTIVTIFALAWNSRTV